MTISPPIPSAPPLATPAEARAAFHSSAVPPNSGIAPGYTQTNQISLPRDYMFVVDTRDTDYRIA
jgi:uncharacterized protein YcsI (UPF0317 family)